MRIEEITDVFKELGLGTQAERNEFLKWSIEDTSHQQQTTFIIESPNSDLKPEIENAQLA
jgi:hypothetical protein